MNIFGESFLTYVIGFIVITITTLILYIKYYVFTYWSRRKFSYVIPSLPFGNFASSMMGKCTMAITFDELYKKSDKPFVGIYVLAKPMLLLRDPEFIKQIFIKDFEYFVDRGFYSNSKRDPLSAHLLALNGDEWKYMRNKITPALSSGKLKHMFPCLIKIGNNLEKYIDNVTVSDNNIIEIKDILARFTTDLIASFAFGIEIDSINNSNEMFRKIGQEIIDPSFESLIRFGLTFMAPQLMDFFRIRTANANVENFITSVVQQTLEYREENNIVREDFMQLLIQLRNGGKVNEDGNWETNIVEEKKKVLSLGQICAQTYVFFIAGFETTSSAMAFTLFEIAKNSEIQKKVQKDVDEGLKKNNNEFSYESINDFKYLDQCFEESMRMYPSVPFVTRSCTKNYKIPNTDLIIEKGTSVIIPVLALHNDPKYFKDPHIYDPDRFTAENKKTHLTFSYIPFGDGPRNCIGMRMAKIQAKAALAMLISKFHFELAPNRSPNIQFEPKNVILNAVGGLELKITRR